MAGKAVLNLKSLARTHTFEAVETLAGIMRSGTLEGARVQAATALLDRGWGKAPQAITGEDGGELTIVIRRLADEDAMKVIEGKTVKIIDQIVRQGDERSSS